MADQQIYQLTLKVAEATDVIPIQDSAGAAAAKKVAVSSLNEMVIGYKIYVARIYNDTGNLDVVVYQNTIGDGSGDGVNDLLWGIASNGVLRATATGIVAFPNNKTVFFAPSVFNGTAYFIAGNQDLGVHYYDVNIVKHDNTQSSTPSVDIFIEIRVYP